MLTLHVISLYEKIRFRENSYSGMFYVVGDVILVYFSFNWRENEYFFLHAFYENLSKFAFF